MKKDTATVVFIFFVVLVVFYWKLFFKGLIPFPGDLLVGAYLPWMKTVPVKNPLISDVFSQFYIWKELIITSFLSSRWPLWNPYSYSGYPLLANFNSGALNPFNVLLVLGKSRGWDLLVISQQFFVMLAMYCFLRSLKLSKLASILGGISLAFSGIVIAWSQFVNLDFALIWICIIFWAIEKRRYSLLSPLVFLLITAGHFQAVVFGLIFATLYFLYSYKLRGCIKYFTFTFLGFYLAAIQLLPSFQMARLSVRFSENYISQYNFGLLPFKNLLTIFAPDYFGNPTTGNFWGFFNYHETIIYVGIFGILAFIAAINNFKTLRKIRFFLIAALISLLLVFDNAISHFLYSANIPFISTSAAGRIVIVLAFSSAVLSAWFFDFLKDIKLRKIIRTYWWTIFVYPLLFGLTYFIYKLFSPHQMLGVETAHTYTAFRNLIFPSLIYAMLILGIVLSRRTKIGFYLILLLVSVDLFRFGWKYTPFVDKSYLFPESKAIDFLKQDPGVFRVAREHGELLPPNTWTIYGLQSPSGYDPMAPRIYSEEYGKILNHSESSASRYSELSDYDAKYLAEFNVKYLLAISRDKDGVLDLKGDNLNYRIKDDWSRVFSDQGTIVLQSKYFKDNRVELSGGQAVITQYSPGLVKIVYSGIKDSKLILKDAYSPGWHAYVNGNEERVDKYGPFRSVEVSEGSGEVDFEYWPNSFDTGLKISFLSLILYLLILRSTSQSDRYRS